MMFSNDEQAVNENALWEKLTETEGGSVPETLLPDDEIHFQFSASIASGFGEALQDRGSPWHECIFHPENELPYSKDVILKSLDCLGASPFTPEEFLNTIETSKQLLNNYVPFEADLPTSPIENVLFMKAHGVGDSA